MSLPCPTAYQVQDNDNFRLSWHTEGGTRYNLIVIQQSVTIEISSIIIRELPSWKSSIYAKADKTIVTSDYVREPIFSFKSIDFPTVEKGVAWLTKEMLTSQFCDIHQK